jgi:hypothetical protein
MVKNYTTCAMHAVSLSNVMDFSCSQNKNSRNFAKIVPFPHDFRIFAKIEKCIFVSTLVGPQYYLNRHIDFDQNCQGVY